MVSIEQLRQALGSKAEGLSDEEIGRINGLLERLAGSLFESWRKELEQSGTAMDITPVSDRI